ncbi:hypothetical protein [Campylobacter troglodytis]|uniref:hypothetical protein n=1 Tax=Campylobacter troglodytis TaxID=654363 RepID=UPI0011576102|nr:hypothetical protein [Campylobacter troglodytis]
MKSDEYFLRNTYLHPFSHPEGCKPCEVKTPSASSGLQVRKHEARASGASCGIFITDNGLQKFTLKREFMDIFALATPCNPLGCNA